LLLTYYELKAREGVLAKVSIADIQEEIAARMRQALALGETKKAIEAIPKHWTTTLQFNVRVNWGADVLELALQMGIPPAAAYAMLSHTANPKMFVAPASGSVGTRPASTPTTGAPRLQGNTQADLDRYNREYRTWVNR
jgi:hypothetical protein